LPTGYSVPKDEYGNYIPRYISHSRGEGGGTNLVPMAANIATADMPAIPDDIGIATADMGIATADMGAAPAYDGWAYPGETLEGGNGEETGPEDTPEDPDYKTDPIVIEG